MATQHKNIAEQIGNYTIDLLLGGPKKAFTENLDPNSELNKRARKRPNAKGNLPQAIKNAAEQTVDFAKSTIPAGLELGSYAVPFGKGANIATKALIPGASVGALSGLSKGDNPAELLGDTVLGAGGAGVLHGAGKVAGKVVKTLTKDIPERLMESAYKEPIKATKTAISKGESLGKEALKRGEKGSTEALYNAAHTQIDNTENTLQTILMGSDQKVSIGDIRKTVKPLIDEYNQAGNATAAKALEARLSAIEAANGKDIPVAAANQIKRSLYDEARKAYGTEASAGMEGIKAIARGIKESLDKIPGVSQLNKDLSFYGRQRDAMLDRMTREQRNNAISLTDAIIGVGGGPLGIGAVGAKKILGSTRGQTGIAQTLNKLGESGGLPPIIAKGITQVAGQAASRLPQIFTKPSSNNNADAPNYESNNNPENPTHTLPPISKTDNITETDKSQETPNYVTGHSPQEHAQAYQAALMAGDEDSAKQIKNLYDMEFEYQKTNKPKSEKPLPVQAQTQVNLAKSGSRGLSEAAQLYDEDPSVLTKQLVPGQWVSRKFDSAMFRAVEALLRARSGAAVPEQEVRRYLSKYGPRFGDSPDVVTFKFDQLQQDFNDVLMGAQNTATDQFSGLPPIQ